MHVLMVWENRNVFPGEYVKGLRGALFAEQRKHLDLCIEVNKVIFDDGRKNGIVHSNEISALG